MKAKDIFVVVRYFDLTVDLEGYKYVINDMIDK